MKAPTLTSFLTENERANAQFDKAIAAATKAERRRVTDYLKSLTLDIDMTDAPLIVKAKRQAYATAMKAVKSGLNSGE